MDRVACDNAYRDLVNQINAKIMLEGTAAYENFVNFANTHIMQYKMNVLTKRKTKTAAVNEVIDSLEM
ncbi:hypothetical protein [Hallerella porci]|uniref:Uncharacterized protein n=1 Tax=Hallerella porci TaxID=1945871 RepID=A0ABX5LJF3_9BACT|nr:hypothetical protein [Hallerella porci]PWK94121.1 hypothetical protein B0H50_1232 [Hallerella porci]